MAGAPAALATRATRALAIRHPIVSAPMAFAAGGALAAAVTRAGGLGLIGGGYGDADWLDAQFDAAAGERVGVGFITWSLSRTPSLLARVLARQPAVVMLSFGDPRPFADDIHAAGATLVCQCQTLRHVQDALDARAGVVVAQGAEAGGHGASRGTLSLVPEVADFLRRHRPQTLLLAAGGIADGRGLAAALMLGADGVLVGTRLWASREALVHARHHASILAANGDGTLRTHVPDIVRQLPWPAEFTARIARNPFAERWHGRERELAAAVAVEGPRYREAAAAGDPDDAAVWFGEAAGLIDTIEPAGVIVERIAAEATLELRRHGCATLA
jgi:nitronate monooxygenase